MQIDRRTTLSILALAAAGAGAAEAQAPAKPEAELESARQDLRDAAQRIARVDLPRSTEPAFSFRA